MARQISWRGVLSPDVPGAGRPERARWRPGSSVEPPRPVVEAARLMQFGALLNLAEVVRALLTRDALRRAFAGEARTRGATVTGADLDRVVSLALTVTVGTALVSAVLWWGLSRATLRGSRWGRWEACGLFVLALAIFFGGLLPTAGLFARVVAVSLLVVGAWALARLWHPDTTAWIRYRSEPQE